MSIPREPAQVYAVNSTGDQPDANTGDGVCATSLGVCTLRAAIQQANANVGSDTIAFDVAGVGPHVVSPASALPSVTGTVTIDGTTEPSYTPGMPAIVLNGVSAGAGVDGLVFASGSDASSLRALVIQGFAGAGVLVQANGVSLTRNFIGTDVTGTSAVANGGAGVSVSGGTAAIGGANYDERNVLSGNAGGGVVLSGSANTLQYCFIGTSASGLVAVGNTGRGWPSQGQAIRSSRT